MHARAALDERFRARVEVAAPFLQSYVQDIIDRERRIAERRLAQQDITQADVDAVVDAFDFDAAVVLDASGRLVRVFPARTDILGSDLSPHYDHLRRALAEGSGVSVVVASAARAEAVVGFAVRYGTPSGNRVFSGAFDISQTPLRAYLTNLLLAAAVQRGSAELIDVDGWIVASGRWSGTARTNLAAIDRPLSEAISTAQSGNYQGPRGTARFVVKAVEGTPWRLVVAIDSDVLYASVSGPRRWTPWLLYGGFTAAVCLTAFLVLRLIESRAELRATNAALDRLARLDRLTDLPNRLYLEERLAALTSAGARHKSPTSVLLIDVDHFKRVNDSFGHTAGDEVLRVLGSRMASVVRTEDVFGRWGGEEFLVLLPHTGEAEAATVADRIRRTASASPIDLPGGATVRATVSIGCATTAERFDDGLLERADHALYRAKELGRDRVASQASDFSVEVRPPTSRGSLKVGTKMKTGAPGRT